MNKFDEFKTNIKSHFQNDVNINLSPALNYRNRCEFSFSKGGYVMYENNKKIYLKSFKVASVEIQKTMKLLLDKINNSEKLKKKLFQINFRSNSSNLVTTSLIYHKKITDNHIKLIDKLSNELKINIIIRSKNFCYSSQNYFFEYHLKLNNLVLYQTDNCFFQPNKFLLEKMITKVQDFINNPKDLLELYCGVGTFSLPLSSLFSKVLATENNRNAIQCLNKAIIKNSISNISSARLSSNEVYELINGKKFNRMKQNEITDFDFSHVLVDPPRSGLDLNTVNILNNFKNVIYISCNQNTYIRDINLLKSHYIEKIELFDQFPNTKHLEIVSLLHKKN